jgi:hypothetical protein
MDFIPWLIAAYLVVCAAAYFGNRMFMYFPDPARIPPAEAGLDGVEEIELKAGDGTRLVRQRRPTGRPSSISTATRPTPPIGRPRSP